MDMVIPISSSMPIGIKPVMCDGKPCIKVVAFTPILDGAIIDQVDTEIFPDGVSGIFDEDGFTLWKNLDETMDYKYHCPYPYKEMPILKEWLQQQNVQLPTVVA